MDAREIWEQLREVKYDQTILYKNFFKRGDAIFRPEEGMGAMVCACAAHTESTARKQRAGQQWNWAINPQDCSPGASLLQ